MNGRDVVAPFFETPDFAILDDIHAEAIRRSGIAPHDGVMTNRAAAPLQEGAPHGIASALVNRKYRNHALERFDINEFAIDAVAPQPVGFVPASLLLMLVVDNGQPRSLGQHDVEIDLAGEPFKELQRKIVDRDAFRKHIVRAHVGGIAPGIPSSDPSLFQNRDVSDAVLFRQIIRGR